MGQAGVDAHDPCDIVSYGGQGFAPVTAQVIKEIPLRIFIEDKELVCLMCSGLQPRPLVTGYLFGCGLIACAEDILSVEFCRDDVGMTARVALREGLPAHFKVQLTSGMGRLVHAGSPCAQAVLPMNQAIVSPDDILARMRQLHERSALYRLTKGCHNAAICTPKEMLMFCSDIGRHNAIDAIVGRSLLEGLPLHDKILVCTGRAASEIVHKVVHAGVPVLVASAVATSLAVRSARQHQLTLVGHVSLEGFWIYSGAKRIVGAQERPSPL